MQLRRVCVIFGKDSERLDRLPNHLVARSIDHAEICYPRVWRADIVAYWYHHSRGVVEHVGDVVLELQTFAEVYVAFGGVEGGIAADLLFLLCVRLCGWRYGWREHTRFWDGPYWSELRTLYAVVPQAALKAGPG